MIDRLKRALIDSYVGVVAIGWMISDAGVRIASAFSEPILTSFRHRLATETFGVRPSSAPIDWQLVFPDLISAAILLAFSYGLLRWLYFAAPPPVQDEPEPDVPASVPD